MRSLRRNREPQLTVDGARLLTHVYLHLGDDFAACRRLTELRHGGAPGSEVSAEALARARLIAYIVQGAELMRNHPTEPLLESIPSHQDPTRAFMALTEVAAALSALVEEELVEEALLTPEELDRLSDLYDLKQFSDAIGSQVEAALGNGGGLPDLGIEATTREVPYVEGGMTELRQFLLTPRTPHDELSELAPEELAAAPEEVRERIGTPQDPRPMGMFLFGRSAGMVFLLAHHGELYTELHRRFREQGPSEDLDVLAIEGAVDIAVLMQSLRRERALLQAVYETPLSPLHASIVLDDLFRSFLLLTGRDETEWMAALDPDRITVSFEHLEPLRDWLEFVGYDKSFLIDAYTGLRRLRAEGATDAELLGRTAEWIDARRVGGEDEEADAEELGS